MRVGSCLSLIVLPGPRGPHGSGRDLCHGSRDGQAALVDEV